MKRIIGLFFGIMFLFTATFNIAKAGWKEELEMYFIELFSGNGLYKNIAKILETNKVDSIIRLRESLASLYENKEEFEEILRQIPEGLENIIDKALDVLYYSNGTGSFPFIKSEKSRLMDAQFGRVCCKMCSVQALLNAKFGKKVGLGDIFRICYNDSSSGDNDPRWGAYGNRVDWIGNTLLLHHELFDKYHMCLFILNFKIDNISELKQRIFERLAMFTTYGAFETGSHTNEHSLVVSDIDTNSKIVTIQSWGKSITQTFDDFFDCLLKNAFKKSDTLLSIDISFISERENPNSLFLSNSEEFSVDSKTTDKMFCKDLI